MSMLAGTLSNGAWITHMTFSPPFDRPAAFAYPADSAP
jgi:hypothetical protein